MRKIALVLISLLSFFSGFTQNDCPSFPKRGSFDSLTFIRSAIPTDPSKSEGIWLGQGTIIRNGSEVRRAFIPDNHPEYALGIVHAWNYHRNLVHRVEKPAIGYWLATVTQETEFICVADAIWSDPNEAPPLYNTANAAYRSTSAANTAASSKGCYQIEGPNGSAWFQLGQNYPSGRFPTSQHDPLAGNFITAAMVKSYYDVYTKEVYQYQKGWDIYEVLDCTADIYAYEIASGSGYNGGINAFASNASWFNGSQNGNNNWQGLAATTANYGGDVAKWISVVENNTTYAKYPAGSSFGGYYTDDITWADVQKYLDQIAIMYPEFDFPTEVTPNAQQAFIKISGSLSTPVPFQEIGPVIDQVILILPREYPQVVEGSPTNTLPSDCSGNKIPYAGINLSSGPVQDRPGEVKLCLGQSATFEIHVEGGGGANPTYKWYRNDAPGLTLSTERIYTYTPIAEETFSLAAEVCNEDGCYKIGANTENSCMDSRNANGTWLVVEDCSSCSFAAQATQVNTPCKGMNAGKITLNLVNAPANYKVKYTATTSLGVFSEEFDAAGSSVEINDLINGSYSFEIEDLSDPTCKAFTSVIVGFDTEINEYVDAEITGVASCIADISAEIKELPKPCSWRLEAVPEGFSWERVTVATVRTSSGLLISDFYNEFLLAPNEYSFSTNAEVMKTAFELSTGDTVWVGTSLATALGGQNLNLDFELFDANGDKVWSIRAPSGNAQPNQPPAEVGFHVVTCPYEAPSDYSFAWAPAVNEVSKTPSKYEGQALVSPTDDITYVVTATNVDNPICQLTDSVTVPFDAACNIGCVDPVSAQIRNSGIDINGVVGVCTKVFNSGYTISTVTQGVGRYSYELFKDGVSIEVNESGVFTLSEEAEYYIEVSSLVDPNDLGCQTTSNTIELQIDGPDLDEICVNEANQLSFADGNQWEWFAGSNSIGIQPANGSLAWTPPATVNVGDIVQITVDKVGPSNLSGQLGASTMNYYAGATSGSSLSFTVTKPVKMVSFVAGCFRSDGGCPAQGQYFEGDLVFTGPSGQNVPVKILSTNAGAGEEEEVIVDAILQPGNYTMNIPGLSLVRGTNGTKSIPGFVNIANDVYVPYGKIKFQELGTYYPQEGCFPLTLDLEAKSCCAGAVITTQPVDETVCAGVDQKFSIASSTAGVAYQWQVSTNNGSTWNNVSGPGYAGGTSTELTVVNPQITSPALQFRVELDASGCKTTSDEVTLTVNPTPALPTAANVEICAGDQLDLAITTPNSSSTYDWVANSATNSFVGSGDAIQVNATAVKLTDEGTYDVVATEGTCSSAAATVTVTINELPQITVQDPAAQCDGNINLTANPVIQSVSPTDAVISVYTDLAATIPATNPVETSGDYYIQAVRGVCKSTVEMVTVEINTTPAVPTIADIEICEGEALIVSVDAPNTDYTYDWSANTATNSFTGAGAAVQVNATAVKLADEGSYDVIATENGCPSAAATINVAIDATPDVATVGADLEVCIADVISLNATTVASGVGAWTFTTTGSATIDDATDPVSTVSGLMDGEVLTATWTIVSDNGFCAPSNATVTVTGKGIATPSVTLIPDLTDVCEGTGVTFTASATTAGSAPLYTFYDISSGSRVEVQGQSNVVSYIATAGTDNLEIEVELESNSTCLGSNSPTVANDVVVNVDALPAAAVVTGNTQTCVDVEVLTADAVNATDIVSWAVTNGAGAMANETATSADVTGLLEGQTTEVTLTVSSANGYCTSNTDVITINRLGAITPADVSGQSTTLCDDLAKPTLSGNTLQTGETATWISNTTGATIDASTGVISAWVVGANEFEYIIRNGGGCTDSDIVTITIDEVPSSTSVGSPTITTCSSPQALNGNVLSVGSGRWDILSGPGNIVFGQENSPSAEIENLVDGTPTILSWVSSNGVCVDHSSASVTVNKLGNITAPQVFVDGDEIFENETSTVCVGSNFEITASSPNSSNNESGQWVIGDAAILDLNDKTIDSPTISSKSIGATSLEWTISSSVGGCPASTRFVNLEIIGIPETEDFVGSALAQACVGEDSLFTITPTIGADEYVWSLGSSNTTSSRIPFAIAGPLKVEVAAKNQCGTDLTPVETTITVYDLPTASIDLYEDCDDGNSVDLNSLVSNYGGASVDFYTDNTGSVQLSGSLANSSGTYGVILTENGCASNVLDVNVNLIQRPNAPSGRHSIVCLGEPFDLEVNSPNNSLTYNWLNVSGNLIGSSTALTQASSGTSTSLGDYKLFATLAGCSSDTVSVPVNLTQSPIATILFDGAVRNDGVIIVCSEDLGTPITAGGVTTEDIAWSLDNSPVSNTISYTFNESGTVELVVDNGVCQDKVSVEVEVRTIEVDISASLDAIDLGQSVSINSSVIGGEGVLVYNWSDDLQGAVYSNASEISFIPELTDEYSLSVTDVLGCQGSSLDPEKVVVYQPIQISTAFSPNNDGFNESWMIKGIEDYDRADITVYSRWGIKVYESRGLYEPWDGTSLKGNDLPPATYYYIIQLNDGRGTKYDGDVSIVK